MSTLLHIYLALFICLLHDSEPYEALTSPVDWTKMFVPTPGQGSEAERTPVFLRDPKDTYVKRGKTPETLSCRAIFTSKVYFKCQNKTVKEELHKEARGIHRTPNGEELEYVEASIDIRRRQLRNDAGRLVLNYRCQCWAISLDGKHHTPSDVAFVKAAFIRKEFNVVPSNERVAVGQNVMFSCEPPNGQPRPEVFWLKNGKEVVSKQDPNVIIDSYSSLLINAARVKDAGNYTCGARNVAGKRLAKTINLNVHINGAWSEWDPWPLSSCDVTCDDLQVSEDGSRIPPLMTRQRYCTNPAPQRGGKTCVGPQIETERCNIKCPVDGKWSEWTEWSKCTESCRKWRERKCTAPAPKYDGKPCVGANYTSTTCSDDWCGKGPGSNQAIKSSSIDSNLALYAGLSAIVLLLVAIIVFVLFLCYRRKGSRNSGYYYNSSPSPMSQVLTKVPPELGPNTLLMQEDTLKHFPHDLQSFGRPPSGGTLQSLNSDKLPRHLIQCGSKAPLINPGTGSHPSSIDSWPPQPPRSGTSHSSSSRESQDGGGYASLTVYDTMDYSMMDKIKEVEPDAISIASACLPPDVHIEDVAFATVGCEGARLIIPDYRVVLTIPQGALETPKEVFVAVAKEIYGPTCEEDETLISPVVFIGPPELRLEKSVVLSMPHSAQLLPANHWTIDIHANDCATSQPYRFQPIATVGHENINTPVYCQLDMDTVHIVTELHPHTQFALVGRGPMSGPPVSKRMRLAVFAPTSTARHETALRVYCLDAAHSPMHSVLKEEAGGARLVLEPMDIHFQEGGPLCLSLALDESSPWHVAHAPAYQEIPAQHVWNRSHQLHCAFSLESATPSPPPLTARLTVFQKFLDGSHGQRTHLLVSVPHSSKPAVHLLPVAQRPADEAFRLPAETKRALSALLDPPAAHNDWRTLAQKLCVDRYVNYYATKPSPTEVILNLWEARDRDATAVGDLAAVLRAMHRPDAAALLS